jgi:hypothetical protein
MTTKPSWLRYNKTDVNEGMDNDSFAPSERSGLRATPSARFLAQEGANSGTPLNRASKPLQRSSTEGCNPPDDLLD